MDSSAILLALAFAALVANLSAFVWGPNLVLLLSEKRPIGRSIGFLIGRGLTLTVASVLFLAGLLGRGVGAGRLESTLNGLTSAPQHWQDILMGLVLLIAAAWLWRRPPAFLQGTSVRDGTTNAEKSGFLGAFALGIGVLFANLLEFAWQGLALGAVVAHSREVVVLVAAVIVWTVVGTADVWVPTMLRFLGGKSVNDRIERLTASLPTLQPWQVALPLGAIGLGFLVWGLYGLVV